MIEINLKNLRLKSGLKAYKIAERLEITPRQFINIEQGRIKNIDKYKEKLGRIYKISQKSVEEAWVETKNGEIN